MKHIFRNLVRMPKSTLLIFAIVFIVLFLEMFGGFIGSVCDECLDKLYGPLAGCYTVDTPDVFTYDGAKYLTEYIDNIEEFHAVFRKEGAVFYGTPDENGKYVQLSYTDSAINRAELGVFTITGVTSCEIAEEFYSGKYVLTKGRMLTKEDDELMSLGVVISDVIAEKNGLDVGSAVRFKIDQALDTLLYKIYPYDLYVIGIYHCNEPDNSMYATIPSAVNTNVVFLPLSIVEKYDIGNFIRSNVRDHDIFPQNMYLRLTEGTDPDKLTALLLSFGMRDFTLSEFSGDAQDSPIVMMAEIVRYCSAAVIFAGAVMLTVITVLTIHSRRREISILCALGKRRSGVTMQFIGEFAVIFVVSVAVSIVLFSFLVGSVEPALESFLNVEQETARITATTSLSFRPGGADSATFAAVPFAELLSKYIFPNSLTALLTGCVELFAVAVIMWIYVRYNEVLTTLGGKN